ncbi:MAG: Sua5/YciO/YrdC/YwlC family protein [Gammaproteobacteria bacterium]|nr:Sua5/YciO/YrdC/YwlC family protein [Gammaproteobacteria bacterium]
MAAVFQLRQAARILHAGGVIAYPTEAVFGLGCDPAAEEALLRILAIKRRPAAAGFILIAAAWEQLDGWIAPTRAQRRRLVAPAPQPVSWVVRAGPLCTPLLTGDRPTLAVRITRHPVAAALCMIAQMPLVSTSANRHGRPPARTALAARRHLGASVDLVVGGATGGARRPSEIRDAATGAVLRHG